MPKTSTLKSSVPKTRGNPFLNKTTNYVVPILIVIIIIHQLWRGRWFVYYKYLFVYTVVTILIFRVWFVYIWNRFVHIPSYSDYATIFAGVLWFLWGIFTIIGPIIGQLWITNDPPFLTLVSFTCLGANFLMIVSSLLVDIYHRILSLCFKIPASAKVVARFKTGIVLGITLLLTVISLFNVTPVVTKTEIILKDLPEAADGFVIVQLSDLHLGPTVGIQFLKDIVKQVNSLQPDLIVMTGGIFDYSFTMYFQPQADQLSLLRSKYGVFYVTGTSEYFGGGADSWGRVLSYLRFVVLHNDIVAIAKDNQTLFELAGVDDWYSGRFYSQWGINPGPNLKSILKRSQKKTSHSSGT